MKLHLPIALRKSILSALYCVVGYTLFGAAMLSADNLVLDEKSQLTLDYADADSILDLNNGTLQLLGDTSLLLSNCDRGDGKTYTLFTGVSDLLDTEGNVVTLNSANNSISNYFDITQSGTGLWSEAFLVLSDGKLQLVCHNEAVLSAVSFTSRKTDGANYQYYEGISFTNIQEASTNSSAVGGAIYGERSSTILLNNNGSLTFVENRATYGGAIGADQVAFYSLCNNGSVTFNGNMATSSNDYAGGGAIFVNGYSLIKINNNGSVSFIGNSVSASLFCSGGAFDADRNTDLELRNNGSVSFIGNVASSTNGRVCGGAIQLNFYGNIELCDNGNVSFIGNIVSSSSAYGGAIYGESDLSIQNNDSVLFEKNAEIVGGAYRLRSIYEYGDEYVISFSAADGKKIEFRDSIFIRNKNSVVFNADYTDDSGKRHKQQGDILFTGAYAESHLNELLAAAESGRSATAEEILDSRTSEVYSLTNLYGGRLRVEDGAIYKGVGITVHEGSSATVRVKNASLDHSGYSLTFNAGTTFDIVGLCSVSGNVLMQDGSTLVVHVEDAHATTSALSLNGLLSLGGSITLTLTVDSSITDNQNYALLSCENIPTNWSAENVVVKSANTAWHVSYNDLYWADNVLWLTFNGSIPKLTVATWSNESGDGEWNTSSKNWSQDSYEYAYVDGVAVVFGDTGAGVVKLVGNLTPSSVLVDSFADYTWSGVGCICGATSLTKQGSGTLTICNANSYTGGTLINGGKVVVGNAKALGTGKVSVNGGTLVVGVNGFNNSMSFAGNSCLAIGAGITYALQSSISNNGSLTLRGSFKADALSKVLTGVDVRVDVDGNEGGTSGFLRAGDFTVTLANGTVNSSNASVSYKGQTLSMNGGVGFGKGTVYYSNYLLTDRNSASVSDILDAADGALEDITMTGGNLTVDDSVVLDATGGNITITADSTLSGSIVDADITAAEGEYESTIGAVIGGESSLTVNGGTITVTGDNTYTGGTTINGGNLTIGEGGSLGSGEVTLNGGTLDTNGGEITNDIINNGGTLITSYVLSEGLTLTVGKGGMHMVGNLTLDGGTLMFQGLPLTMDGKVSGESAVNVFVSGYGVIDMDGTVTLAEFGNDVQGITNSSFVNTGYGNLNYDAANHTLNLTLTNKNIWVGGKGASWVQGLNVGWQNYETFEAGNRVVFNTGGSVKIVGGVEPSSVLVDVEKSLTFSTSYNKKTGLYSGAIVGKGCVVKRGKGTLTLNDGNEYIGGTFIEAGTVKAKGATSFGTGAITLSGGAVDLASKAVGNDIVLDGSAAVKGGKKYEGEFTMNGGELLKGSLINVADSAELQSGVVNGTLSGVGTVEVEGAVTLGASGKITTNALEIDGSLSVSSKGLVMNSKASAITIDGGTLSSAGKISAYSMNMTGGTLDVTNAKPMSITLKDAFVATAGADIDLYGALTANQLTLEGVDFTLAMDEADIAPKVQPKAQSLTLKGKGVLNTISDSELDIAGKVSVTGDLALLDSTISLHDVAGAAKPKAQGLTVKGVLIADGTELVTTGAISAAALTASESVIAIAAEEGLAAQSLKLTRKDATKGVPQDNILSDCAVYVNGSMSVAGNLQLQESYLALRDYSGKNKAKGLSVKGDLTVGSGSVLSLTGALSAKNLTLEGGSSLTLGSAKLSTVKVGGALTLNGAVNFDLGFTVTEKDVAKGKEYTLFSFKSLVGDISNLTLGYEGAYTLALNTKETAIILTVSDAAAWNAYVADVQEALKKDEPMAEDEAEDSAVAAAEEAVEAEDLLLKPVAAAADIDPLLAKAADTLVQSTWGTVGASRAFGETIASRGRNATLLGEEGKGAAWLSVMGGSSRISSADGHNGADFTLSGAAFGVEGRVGEKSTLGVAIGNSWGKVSTFSAFPVDQDSMHVGIYGNHTLTKSLTLSWMATHTRTESEATILGAPYSWSQDALQLDAHLTWGKSISDKTAVSAFAGLQYLATDSGECAGLKTGSLQNLRAELGVGASHKLGENTMVFGELSFIGDMVRNNPTASIGDYRTHGTNPGRVGMNLSVGAQHQLSEDWSLNASYSLELMENSTSHSLNVGASYSF